MINYLNGRERANDDDPFFIYFGFSHPHDVRDGTPDLLKKYGAVNHLDKKSLPPANPKAPSYRSTGCPSIPFTTVTQACGTRSRSAEYVNGATK